MHIEAYDINQVLFKEGDIGDKFYIIYEGRVGILTEAKGLISELHKGDSFGELSLLFGNPRSGTAVILEKTELISLSRESYDLTIKVKYKQENNSALGYEHFNFLRTIPLFSKMSKLSARYLTQIAVIKKYPASSQIIRQGDLTGFIFVIYSGSVKLFKEMNFRATQGSGIESLIRTPTSKDMCSYKQIFLEEVNQGYIIGGYEFFNNAAMQYTAI